MKHSLLLGATLVSAWLQVRGDPLQAVAARDGQTYFAWDDRSWAINTVNLSDPGKQVVYDEYMVRCRKEAVGLADSHCDKEEDYRLQMNMYQPRSVRNYTETGFLKIKAPQSVFEIIRKFWEANRHDATIEWKTPNPYHNSWEAPPTILRIDNKTLVGGGAHIQASIANAARDAMEAWTGLPQASSSVYGIRVYHNNSILSPHVDRLPLVSSAIINVAQDVDEDWFLEVFDHDGVAHNITMEPGDLVLYESHSVIHGRPFPMNGKFYANIFVHFEPLGPPKNAEFSRGNLEIPPYLIEGSSWEPEWREKHPDGWKLLNEPCILVTRNDLRALRYLAEVNPSKLHDDDGSPAKWKPVHEAARQGYLDVMKFLVEEHGVDVNERCNVMGGMTPLGVAQKYQGKRHEVSKYLESKGAVAKISSEKVTGEEL